MAITVHVYEVGREGIDETGEGYVGSPGESAMSLLKSASDQHNGIASTVATQMSAISLFNDGAIGVIRFEGSSSTDEPTQEQRDAHVKQIKGNLFDLVHTVGDVGGYAEHLEQVIATRNLWTDDGYDLVDSSYSCVVDPNMKFQGPMQDTQLTTVFIRETLLQFKKDVS